MTTFPTAFPFKETRIIGSQIANVVAETPIYKKLISRFDVLHFNDRAHPYTRRTASNCSNAKLLTMHWVPSKVDYDYFTKMDAIVAPTKYVSRYLEEVLGIQSVVIRHGVDTTLFNTRLNQNLARQELGLPSSKKVVLWIGRIDYNKDLRTLIDAIPRVVKDVPDSLFVIKGRTSSKKILNNVKDRLKSTGTEKNVRLMMGWDFITKMPTYYRASDAFVITSHSEVCSLVFLEALACGLPVISTNIPSIRELGGDSTQYYEVGNSEELAGKLIAVLGSKKKSDVMRSNSLRRISDLELTLDKVSKKYKDLYLSIM